MSLLSQNDDSLAWEKNSEGSSQHTLCSEQLKTKYRHKLKSSKEKSTDNKAEGDNQEPGYSIIPARFFAIIYHKYCCSHK